MPPKICHSCIRTVLNWRQLKGSKCRKGLRFPPHLPKNRTQKSLCEGVPPSLVYQEEENSHYHWRQKDNSEMGLHKQSLLKQPLHSIIFPIYLPSHNLLSSWAQTPFLFFNYFSMTYHPLLKWYKGSQAKLLLWIFVSFRKASVHKKKFKFF